MSKKHTETVVHTDTLVIDDFAEHVKENWDKSLPPGAIDGLNGHSKNRDTDTGDGIEPEFDGDWLT